MIRKMKQIFKTLCGLTLANFTLTACQSTPVASQPASERATAAVRDLYPGWESKAPIEISKSAFDASNEVFQTHPDYLALNTPFAPIADLLQELQKREQLTLKNRGEAHVTVLTPPEVKILGEEEVPMRAIEIAADRLQMSDSDIDPICLGMGQAMINGKMERTYFLVVHSENLLRVRREVASQAKPVGEKRFEAEPFYPHITVGFTLQDLFEQQGVVKDRSACLYPLKLMP